MLSMLLVLTCLKFSSMDGIDGNLAKSKHLFFSLCHSRQAYKSFFLVNYVQCLAPSHRCNRIVCSVCAWVLCQGCVFPCIVNCPQCMTVAVGCPVKRPRDVSCLPKHHGMWHTVCWPITSFALFWLVQNSWRLTVFLCGREHSLDPVCSYLLAVSRFSVSSYLVL